jgi:hypothetical protein
VTGQAQTDLKTAAGSTAAKGIPGCLFLSEQDIDNAVPCWQTPVTKGKL